MGQGCVEPKQLGGLGQGLPSGPGWAGVALQGPDTLGSCCQLSR